MALKINKIEVKGLLGFKHLVWNLKDVNILGGRNGQGKSTLLKLCYYLLKDGGLPSASRLNKLADSVNLTFSDGSVMSWCHRPHTHIGAPEGSSVFVDATNRTELGDVQVTSIRMPDGSSGKTNDFIKQFRVDLVNSFEQNISDALGIAKEYATVDMDSNVTYLDAMIKREMEKRNEMFAGAVEKLFATIADIQGTSQKIDVSKNSDVQSYLELYPVIHHFFQEYEVSINNRMVFKRGGKDISYQGLSMGEKQLLYVLLKVTNTNHSPSIMLLDEPDLGMHIVWKEQLIKKLYELNPEMQLLVTTHAPSMIKGWRECVSELRQMEQGEE